MSSRHPSIFFVTFICLFGLLACRKKSNKDLFDTTPIDAKNVQFNSISLDTVALDSIETSYDGFISIENDSILFIDRRFGWVFDFNKNGNLSHRYLGQGKGPKELPTGIVAFYASKPDGGHFFIGRSNDTHNFDKHYRRIKSYFIDWNSYTSPRVLKKNPTPDDPKSYNLAYNVGNIKATSKYIYLPLASAPPPYSDFNLTTDLYAKKARILAKMNIKNSKIIKLIGRLSPVYSVNRNIRLFYNFSFDIIKGRDLAVTYQADSLIYIFDKDFKNLKYAFGYSGKNMDLNYQSFPSTTNDDKIRQYWKFESTHRGYYTSLRYVRDRNMFFRSYTKGGGSTSDGLQIYNDSTLIADVRVPKSFKVTGYIPPYFYSNAFIDARAGTIKLYRFRLPLK